MQACDKRYKAKSGLWLDMDVSCIDKKYLTGRKGRFLFGEWQTQVPTEMISTEKMLNNKVKYPDLVTLKSRSYVYASMPHAHFSRSLSRFLSLGCLLCICFSLQGQGLIQRDKLIRKTDSVIRTYERPNHPGMAVAIISEGQIISKTVIGMASLEHNIPISPSTKFHTASVSKQFTAFAILLLAEKGQLSLNDNIRKYLPEIPDFGYKITLNHLITHTSGLRDQWNLFLLQGVRPDDVITTDHVLKLISQQSELNFKPGEEYLYSNTGFTLLAEIISRVSGQTFSEFTRENIFLPLKMSNTSFVDDHEQIIQNKASSYYETEPGIFKKRALNYATPGATNLLSTVEDLSLWTINFKEQRIGNPIIFERMQALATTNNGNTFGGASGLFISNYKGLREVGHGGADAGFRAQISMFPDQDFTVIVLGNSASIDAEGITHRLVDISLALDNTTTPFKKPAQPKFISLNKRKLKVYEGNYVNRNRGFTRHIYLEGDSLMHFRTENNESALAPLSENTFKVMNVPPDVIVAFSDSNGVLSMTETVNGGAPRPLEKFDPKPYTEEDWLELQGSYWSPELNTAYTIQYKDGNLTAMHQRMGMIHLQKVKHDFFLGDKGFFGQVDFIRDTAGVITGLKVSNGRVRNLWFEKR